MTGLFWTMTVLFVGLPIVLYATMRTLEWLYPPQERVPIRTEDKWDER